MSNQYESFTGSRICGERIFELAEEEKEAG